MSYLNYFCCIKFKKRRRRPSTPPPNYDDIDYTENQDYSNGIQQRLRNVSIRWKIPTLDALELIEIVDAQQTKAEHIL